MQSDDDESEVSKNSKNKGAGTLTQDQMNALKKELDDNIAFDTEKEIKYIELNNKDNFCTVRATSDFKFRWDILIMILAIFNCISVPLQVAFDPPTFNNTSFTIANYVIDFIFLIDIIICFRTIYMDELGVEY